MKKLRIIMLALCMILANITMTTNIMDIKAATTQTTYNGTNIGNNDYYVRSTPRDSFLSFENDKIVRLQQLSDESLLIENYDLSYNFIDSKIIGAEAELFGGAYFTSDANYLVWGNSNFDEDDTKEVYRISKYDKNWNYLKSTGLNGANTYIPFDAGSCDITMIKTSLVIRTCHEMYQSDDGYHHQANVAIVVNSETMEIIDSNTGVSNVNYGYVSHSFNQKVEVDGNDVIGVDHGDAYPRSIVLIKYRDFNGSTSDYVDAKSIYSFPGDIGNNYTGATLGGLAISPSNYLVAGSSVKQDDNYIKNTTSNIFVGVCNKDLSSSTINWLTDYPEGEDKCSTPYIEKINDNKFIVLWSRVDGVYYTFVDASGQTISETIFMKDADLSDCEPVLNGNKLVWYIWKDEEIRFYEINMEDIIHPGVITLNNGVRDERQYCSDGVHAQIIDCEQLEPTCTDKGLKPHRQCSRCKEYLKSGSDSEIIDVATIEIPALGHDYRNYELNGDGTFTSHCSRCDGSVIGTVPTDLSFYFNNTGSGSYSSGYSRTQHVGTPLYVCVFNVTPTEADESLSFEISDPEIASVEEQGYNYVITFNKPGKVNIKISATFNSELYRNLEINVQCAEGSHQPKYVEQVDPTCNDVGYQAHWECEACGVYLKSESEQEIVSSSTYQISALGHDYYRDEINDDGTYTSFCSRCDSTISGICPTSMRLFFDNTLGSPSSFSSVMNNNQELGLPLNVLSDVAPSDANDELLFEISDPEMASVEAEGYFYRITFHEVGRVNIKVSAKYNPSLYRELSLNVECGDNNHEVQLVDRVEPTCTQDGMQAHYECRRCHKRLLADGSVDTNPSDIIIDKLGHEKGIHHQKIEATCTETGLREYYECSRCNQKLLLDNSEVEDVDLFIEALGHDWNNHEAIEATCEETGKLAYKECSRCHEIRLMNDSVVEDEASLSVNKLGHDYRIYHEKVEATCAKEGAIEHQECSRCHNKALMDGTRVTDRELVIKKIPHEWINHEKVIATCNQNGKQAYKECSSCHELQLMNGNVVNDEKQLMIAKLAHEYKFSRYSNGKYYQKCIHCHEEVECEAIFKDVNPKAWYVQSVYDAYAKGLMVGINDENTLFSPDDNISRGMVATVLYRMAKAPKVTFSAKFPDVKNGLWYSNAIIWANQVGVVKGYDSGKFGVDDNITRQDLAIMLRNYAMKVGKLKASEKADLSKFKDVKAISPYALPSVEWAVANKLISGKENGTKVAPIDNATRAECAKMFNALYNICQRK